jgi:hypothetical protein
MMSEYKQHKRNILNEGWGLFVHAVGVHSTVMVTIAHYYYYYYYNAGNE